MRNDIDNLLEGMQGALGQFWTDQHAFLSQDACTIHMHAYARNPGPERDGETIQDLRKIHSEHRRALDTIKTIMPEISVRSALNSAVEPHR